MNDFRYMDEAQENAQSAGFSNFGKLTVTQVGMKKWNRDADGNIVGRPSDITGAEWDKLPKKDKFVEVMFSIDVQEFNPELQFTYERKVSIIGGKKSDWAQIVSPSIDKVFGKGKMLSQLNGLYVEVQDVPQINDPQYNTIQFVRVFKNRDEAFAAYQEKKGGGKSAPVASDSGSEFPPIYGNMDTWIETAKFIKADLEAGQSLPDVAKTYGVDVSWVNKAKSM